MKNDNMLYRVLSAAEERNKVNPINIKSTHTENHIV